MTLRFSQAKHLREIEKQLSDKDEPYQKKYKGSSKSLFSKPITRSQRLFSFTEEIQKKKNGIVKVVKSDYTPQLRIKRNMSGQKAYETGRDAKELGLPEDVVGKLRDRPPDPVSTFPVGFCNNSTVRFHFL